MGMDYTEWLENLTPDSQNEIAEKIGISIRLGMTDAQTRSTLAHELAHAEAGDPCGVIPLAERAADRRAPRC